LLKKGYGNGDRQVDSAEDQRVSEAREFLKLGREGKAKTEKGHAMKKFDGNGLYLTFTGAGDPTWRIKYVHGGDERVFTIGPLDETDLAGSIEMARAARAEVRAQLKEGYDPVQKRRVMRADNIDAGAATFEAAQKVLWSVRSVLEEEKAEGHLKTNSVPSRLAVLGKGRPSVGLPALLTFPELGDVLRRADAAHISPAVRMAHRLMAFTATRNKNVVGARWAESDLDSDTPKWVIPRVQMKVDERRSFDHVVWLGPTITGELRRWRDVTGGKGYLFPPLFGK
jgi:integrase